MCLFEGFSDSTSSQESCSSGVVCCSIIDGQSLSSRWRAWARWFGLVQGLVPDDRVGAKDANANPLTRSTDFMVLPSNPVICSFLIFYNEIVPGFLWLAVVLRTNWSHDVQNGRLQRFFFFCFSLCQPVCSVSSAFSWEERLKDEPSIYFYLFIFKLYGSLITGTTCWLLLFVFHQLWMKHSAFVVKSLR